LTAQAAMAPVLGPAPTRVPPSRSKLATALFYGVFGVLLLGPLAFGETEPWSIFLMEAGAAVLLIFWIARQMAFAEVRIQSSPLFPPMLAFAALIAVQLVFGWTAYRYRTFSSALMYCAYGMLCFLAVQVLRHAWQVKTLATVLSIYGFSLATFAFIQGITSNGKLYWVRTVPSGSGIYGPYANHNHYAGLMEMLFPIPLAVSLSRQVRGWHRAMAAFAAAAMASTIFLSGSRGGMVAFAVQMALLTALLFWKKKPGKAALVLGIFGMAVVGLLMWLGGGEVTERITSIHTEARQELSGGMRLAIDRDCLKMFWQRPILGWGLGAFPDVYPQFRSFYSDYAVDRAHNDYLQLLVETGAVGMAIMLWFVAVVYRSALPRLSGRTDTNGAVALAALLGVTGILAHSLFDFNLQIPANAAFFFVLCAIAAMEPRFGRARKHRDQAWESPKVSSTSADFDTAAMD
jgi:O-antigen ligase